MPLQELVKLLLQYEQSDAGSFEAAADLVVWFSARTWNVWVSGGGELSLLLLGDIISIAKSSNLHSMQECQGLGTVDDLLLVNLLLDSHFWKSRSIAIIGTKKVFKMRKSRKKHIKILWKVLKHTPRSGNFPVLCSNEGRQEIQMHLSTWTFPCKSQPSGSEWETWICSCSKEIVGMAKMTINEHQVVSSALERCPVERWL